MSVTSIRSAISAASKDKRITETEGRAIAKAALSDASGAADGLTLGEARVLADFFTAASQPNAEVKVGGPAMRLLQSLLSSNLVPVGTGLQQVTNLLQAATPFEPGPKLARAPSLGQRFEVPLGVDPELPNGPKRTAFVDPEKKNAYLKLERGGRTSWAGPVPLTRPGAEGSYVPQTFALTVAGGGKVSTVNNAGFTLAGGIPAGGSLTVDLGTGSKVTVRGPLAKSWDVFRALDKALPSGVYARTAARFIEEYIAERPATDSRVISLAKGSRPGELEESDLIHARTLRRQLGAVAQGSATNSSAAPKWNASAGLYRAGNANFFAVPLGTRIALIDPKTNTAFFAKEGSGHRLSAVTGPVSLVGTSAAFQRGGRYFTWENVKLLGERATNG